MATRPGDILLPAVTRSPRARLIDSGLQDVYPNQTVTLLRPLSTGPPPERIVEYLTSREFFNELSTRASSLKDRVRITANALLDMPFNLPDSDVNDKSVVVLIDNLARSLIALIAKRRSALHEIEWRDLERVLATALDGLGFEVELTPPAKDGGKDLVVHCAEMGTKRRYVIEVKHWCSGKRVSGTELRKFIEVVATEHHDAGLFLSTSGFSRNAYTAEAHLEHRRVRLGGETKILRICQMYVESQSGILLSKPSTEEMILDDTCGIDDLRPGIR